MAAVFGAIVAQEVIKATSQKFTPIDQFFFLENLECLPDQILPKEEYELKGTRYDAQIAIFGRSFNEKLRNLKYFVVGAGAIGCEMLKNFAMMGIGTGPKGHVTVTDMDSIEISNLNRQFLFKGSDVTQLKSDTAARAVKNMNPDLNIYSKSVKVANDTENTFDHDFWNQLDGVVTALDNFPARLYVDRKCVFYHKPLIDSGTLASKGNVQVVVPPLTESYGSSTDPPAKETPICLLHSFPNNIEHCLQWAREDLFEGQFVKNPEIVNSYLANPKLYISSLSPNMRYPTLEILKEALLDYKPDFDDCIRWARMLFEQRYNWRHRQLLHNFPEDYTDQNGVPFWSGAKRPPKPLVYSPDSPDRHDLDFVVSATFLRAYTLGINISELKPSDLEAYKERIKSFSLSLKVPDWTPKHGIKIVTDERITKEVEREMDDDEEIKSQEIISRLEKLHTSTKANPLTFEKDNDQNFHIDFINAASNLRAYAYGIKPVSRLKSKIIAGRIIPAMITTTALVTGLVCLEIYKLLKENYKIEDFCNTFVNLALPLFQQSEPIPPTKRKFLNKEFTIWDHIDIKEGDITLEQFIAYVKKNLKIVVDMLGVGSALIYSSFGPKGKERLPKKLSQLVEQISKVQLGSHQKYFQVEITGTDLQGRDIEDMPDVYFWFRD
eukprot:TRINITY_DN5439_c0_g1_i1.p1 TRINITY_DN5439_c0_g1~~TRINITY_DN5439_c0_g1_i1.p1  ORF type:complete len:683 (+),score=139.32 TRINITY_DN5439_c0_g1_i1:56-2050(+)